MKNKKGFTIIELIVVISIIGIISIIAAPHFANTNVFQENSDVNQVKFLLKTAQKIAIAQRRDIYILVNGQQVDLCYTNTNPCPNNELVSFQNQSLMINIKSSLSIPSGLFFNSLGIVGNNLITITVGSQNIDIEGGTGYVHQ